MAQNLLSLFFFVAVICILPYVDAVDLNACTGTDASDVPLCINPFITAHTSAFVTAAATPSTCNLVADCTVVNTAAVCLNSKPLSNTCKQSLRADFKTQMTAAMTVCTLDDLYRLCPSSTKVDEGSSSGRPVGSLLLVTLTIICVLLFSRTN